MSARERLAQRQAELLRSLLGVGPVPAGFDRERVEVAGESLASKRGRVVARTFPALAASLGDRFPAEFAAYAAEAPGTRCPVEDGLAFARDRVLDDAAVLEVLRAERRFLSLRRLERGIALASCLFPGRVLRLGRSS